MTKAVSHPTSAYTFSLAKVNCFNINFDHLKKMPLLGKWKHIRGLEPRKQKVAWNFIWTERNKDAGMSNVCVFIIDFAHISGILQLKGSLAKWFSVCLRTKWWSWVPVPLQWLLLIITLFFFCFFIIELTHSKTILEIPVEIEPQPAALDFKNLSQCSSRSK